jgi:hypothetical protein
METEALEKAAMPDIMLQRRAGKFVSASNMDERLALMLARKREANAV